MPMTPADALHAAHVLAPVLPSPAWVFGCIAFGLAGLAAWRYGKVAEVPRIRWLGVALVLYPYVVSRTWLLYAIGLALCAAIWHERPRRD